MDGREKCAVLILALGLMGMASLSACDPTHVSTMGWDHMDLAGTAVRIWGQLALAQSPENWNEGLVWDTQTHDNFEDYANRVWADNYGGANMFSANLEGLDRFTEYHYRAFGEDLDARDLIKVGLDSTFIPGGPRVNTYAASSIDLTSADLNGELWHMGGAAETEVFFAYGKDPQSLDMETDSQTMADVGDYAASVADLESCKQYSFRAVATNDADTKVGWTLIVTPGKPDVVTRLPSVVGVDTATFEGELWDLTGSPTADVWFQYGDSSPNDLNLSTPPQTMDITGEFSAEVAGLHPNTTYWVSAVSYNGVCQAAGAVYSFKTQTGTD